MIQYFLKYPSKIVEPFLEHLSLTAVTMVYSILFAILLSVLIMRSKLLSQWTIGVFSGIYCIPSLALFALLIPFLGIGKTTAIVVLVLYNQFYLIRSILTGFLEINPNILSAAKGMGMTDMQVLFQIKLPLASPVILSGIRLALISTISIATIAATINAGGLGTLLFDGMRTRNTTKILWGVLLSALLNVLASLFFSFLEKKALRYTHRGSY